MARISLAGQALAVLCVVCAEYQSAVARTLTDHIRENNQTFQVWYEVLDAESQYFGNGTNCGDTGHRTHHPTTPRYFAHFHMTYAFPKNGEDSNMNLHTVSEGTINAFWDFYYANKTREQTADPQYNCWGYAMGYDVWVQDPTWLYDDNYTLVNAIMAGNLIDIPQIGPQGWHCRKIVSVCDNEAFGNTIQRTREKNRVSGVYLHTFACPGGGSIQEENVQIWEPN